MGSQSRLGVVLGAASLLCLVGCLRLLEDHSNEVAKADWFAKVEVTMVETSCLEGAPLTRCYGVETEQCAAALSPKIAACREQLLAQMPEIVVMPRDGWKWGAELGGCAEGALQEAWVQNLDASCAPAETTLLKWNAELKKTLPAQLCTEGSYFRRCYSGAPEECIKRIDREVRVCLNQVKLTMPKTVQLPGDDSRWRQPVVQCAGAAWEELFAIHKLGAEGCEGRKF